MSDDFIEGLRKQAAEALFPEQGSFPVHGLKAPARIRRDGWGVPYISAASLEDLWFAQGLFTAGERLFQLDLTLRAANGRLSELFSSRTLPDDRFARTIGFNRIGARLIEDWDDESLSMHERFREGVFAWLELMPVRPIEYMLLDVEPELPSDPAAWAAAFAFLGWGLSGNWDHELLRTWISERAGDDGLARLMPPLPADPPDIHAGGLHGALLESMPRARGQGSNNWVVSGSMTASGKPLLANDPHLLVTQPGAWIEMHLSAPGYRARGVALTFSPGVLLGTTEHHAWGVTNVTGDVQDLFIERLDEDREHAEFRGSWEPLTRHAEPIDVRGEPEPQVLEVLETRHGPILDTYVVGLLEPEHRAIPPTHTYALSWAGSRYGILPSLALSAARAGSFAEFREAAATLACPGQNVVYAGVDGEIGYCMTGMYPMRARGDGTLPVPGWTGEHEWAGFLDPRELPWATDPQQGFLVTANNRTFVPDYPHLIGHDFHSPYRARRIAQRLAEREDHDVASMTAIQMDTVSLPAREVLPLLLRVEPETHEQRAALELLDDWDADMAADSAPAALFNSWSSHIARRTLEPTLGAELFEAYHTSRETWQTLALPGMLEDPEGWLDRELLLRALDGAVAELTQKLGSNSASWRWGALHKLRMAHPLASIPGLEPLFLAAEIELGGDEQTVMQGGFDGRDGYRPDIISSWRAVYDLADLDRSVGVLPSGISGNPASTHWNDQADMWAEGRYHSLPFTEEAVRSACVSVLDLVPG